MLRTSQTENQELTDTVPEAEVPDNPPAEIPNLDVPDRDAVQIDDQIEAAPIENEQFVARPNNLPRRLRRITNQRQGVSLILREQ